MKFVSTIISERCFGFSPCQHLFSQARHIGLPGRHLWDISGHEKFNADADCKQNIYGLIQATNWEVLRLKFVKHSRHTLMNFSICLQNQAVPWPNAAVLYGWPQILCADSSRSRGGMFAACKLNGRTVDVLSLSEIVCKNRPLRSKFIATGPIKQSNLI